MVQQEVHPDEFTTPTTSHFLSGGLMLGTLLLSRLSGLPFVHSVIFCVGLLILLPTFSLIFNFIFWRPFFTRWPAHHLAPDARTRKAEMILGYLSRLGVDSYGVHVSINPPTRWFGAQPFSIPWSEIHWCPRSRWDRFMNVRKLQAGGDRTFRVPDWVYHHTPSSSS